MSISLVSSPATHALNKRKGVWYTLATFLTLGEAKAIHEFSEDCEVFVVLPTGEGKCLCFATIPLIFDYLRAN